MKTVWYSPELNKLKTFWFEASVDEVLDLTGMKIKKAEIVGYVWICIGDL